MPDKEIKLAQASFDAVNEGIGAFYIPNVTAAAGLTPEKLVIPREYHSVIDMCYDFYQRGGIVSTVINRLAELAVTEVANGQRKTSDEANNYFDAVLHRSPSYLSRFLRTAALEYFISGMVLPRVDWETVQGKDLSPKLNPGKEYLVPVFDLYPPKLIKIEWAGWGKKTYLLKIPSKDVKLIQSGGSKIKKQQQRYDMWLTNYPSIVDLIRSGADSVPIDVNPILRKETSITEYPTPFLFNVLEGLIFKQQLRRMDFAVASRVINAILLIQEGDKDFPSVDDPEGGGNLAELKKQIYARTNDPRLQERLFILFTNHTTKLTWIIPDVTAMLDQDKYKQTNDEINEALGFAKILITGESRNSQASEVSTWAIQPMMEELRSMLIEWVQPIYEEAATLNKFRSVPEPLFSPIRLQDFIKTAAVFAQAFKEGNISRITRDRMMGLSFETEVELMQDEYKLMDALPDTFPEMPYNVMVAPGGAMTGLTGRPDGSPNKGGRPKGTQNPPLNRRKTGTPPSGRPVSKLAAEEEITLLGDEELINLFNTVAEERGIVIRMEDIAP